jgi:hypothetical protein
MKTRRILIAACAAMFAFAFGSCGDDDIATGNNGTNNNNGGNGGNGTNNEYIEGLTFGAPMVSDITDTSATFTCTLTIDETVISNPQEYFAQAEAGFCYCPVSQGRPSVENSTKIDALQSAFATEGHNMTAAVSSLTPGVRYNVCAYITLDGNTYYSAMNAFSTLDPNNGGGGSGDNDNTLVNTNWIWDTTVTDMGFDIQMSARINFTTLTRGTLYDTSYYRISYPDYGIDTTVYNTNHTNFTYTLSGSTGTILEDDDDQTVPFTLVDAQHLSIILDGMNMLFRRSR